MDSSVKIKHVIYASGLILIKTQKSGDGQKGTLKKEINKI
jgi:hypothetical protein